MDSDGFPALSVGFYKTLTHGGLRIRYFIRLTQLCGFVAASHCGCYTRWELAYPARRLTFASYKILAPFDGSCFIASRLPKRPTHSKTMTRLSFTTSEPPAVTPPTPNTSCAPPRRDTMPACFTSIKAKRPWQMGICNLRLVSFKRPT